MSFEFEFPDWRSGMSNVNDIVRDLRLQTQLTQCAGPCGASALTCFIIGAVGFPYLANRGLSNYLPPESRFLLATFSTVLISYLVGYRSKIKCEENVIKLFAEQREKELEEKKEDLRRISPLRRFFHSLT